MVSLVLYFADFGGSLLVDWLLRLVVGLGACGVRFSLWLGCSVVGFEVSCILFGVCFTCSGVVWLDVL